MVHDVFAVRRVELMVSGFESSVPEPLLFGVLDDFLHVGIVTHRIVSLYTARWRRLTVAVSLMLVQRIRRIYGHAISVDDVHADRIVVIIEIVLPPIGTLLVIEERR